ncbi:DNA primase [Microcoleus sp. FACHB-68]|uniref:DNA primase n=1 Tax=Microcoleus sp. FACHB-68 TaxID=2692826 RepID=UPI0016826D53|nr:DNA primase [Microcoleus sp. FACHB-68]MBD1939521.1 DNA primase [Microcoleus sp. FACHB-68]
MDTPRLHPDTIEEVKQRVDIVDVISEHVVLRKRGKDYVGLCPFHEEKSPSFTVSPGKQMYYCFGCNAGGNAIGFLKEVGKQSYSDVVLDLAKRYQVPIKTLQAEHRQEFQRQISIREQLYEILAIASSFYQHALTQPQGKLALDYLQSERQLSQETIQQFQLGYAPAGWDTLYRYLVEVKQQPVQLVEQAGLIAPRKSGSGYYDRFRERLIIPIHDIQGRTIGFGGRTLTDEQPKYLNSPETELFDKGRTLFALDKARNAISKEDQAVVVEGYFDAIALHAAGIANVVASLGTALSLDQVRQLLRHTESKQIVLNFDADKAGTNAADRAIGEISDLAYRGEVQLRILNIPEGKDADEFLKTYSSQQYRELLANASLWLDWKIQQTLLERNLTQADQFQQVATAMVKLLCNISNDNQLTHYINRCAELLSQGDSRRQPLLADNLLSQIVRYCDELLSHDESCRFAPFIESRLQQNKRRFVRRAGTPKSNPDQALPLSSERNLLEKAEALLLLIYLHYPEHRQAVMDALEERDLEFSLSHHRFLWRQISEIPAAGSTPAQLISTLQDRCLELSEDMAVISPLFYLDERTKQEILRTPLVIRAAAASIERVMCEKRYRLFLDLWRNTDSKANPDLFESYLQQLYAEQARIQELDRQRHTTFSDLVQLPWIGNFVS